MKHKKNRKKILFFLPIFIFFFLFGTKIEQANATGIPVVDAALIADFSQFSAKTQAVQTKQLLAPSTWNIARKEVIEPALEAAAKQFAIQLIKNITESTINWINNGFQGQPVYVSNLGNFLQSTGDQTIGSFINDSSLSFLCQPFQLQIKMALGLSASQSFSNKISCTLSGVIGNTTNAINSATYGGWANFIQVTQEPQNNPIGAYILAQSELNSRIQSAQQSKTAELSWGMGALSYQNCTDTTYDSSSGNPISTKTSSNLTISAGSSTESLGPPAPTDNTNGTKTEHVCTVETPGAVITNMLGFSATSDQRTLELRSALSTGIDSILNSLFSELAKLAISKIQNGLLNPSNNTDASLQLQSTLDSLSQQIAGQTNSTLNNITNNTDNNFLSNQFDNYGSTYSGLFTPAASTQTQQGVFANDPLAKDRVPNLQNIALLMAEETNYKNTYSTAAQILTDAKAIFENARTCNAQYSNTINQLRAQLITSNIITNIDGTTNYNRTVATIQWNLTELQNAIDTENQKLNTLTSVESAVMSATDTQGIIAAMIPVSSGQFGIAPDKGLINNISTWLKNVGSLYSTTACPIDTAPAMNNALPPLVTPDQFSLFSGINTVSTPSTTNPITVTSTSIQTMASTSGQ